MNVKHLFNSNVEIGIRILTIIEACESFDLSLDKIMYLDYLMLYGVKNKKGETLHPSYRMQILELTAHRDIIKKSILYLIKKDLITVNFNYNGIFYHSNANSFWYVQNIGCNYSMRLKECAIDIAKMYKDLSVEQLKNVIREEV